MKGVRKMNDDKFENIISTLQSGKTPVVNSGNSSSQGLNSSQRGLQPGMDSKSFGLNSVNKGLSNTNENKN